MHETYTPLEQMLHSDKIESFDQFKEHLQELRQYCFENAPPSSEPVMAI